MGLAQALIGNPPVLILDEPTVGLDPKQMVEIRTLIKKLGKITQLYFLHIYCLKYKPSATEWL